MWIQDYHLLWCVFPDISSHFCLDPRSLGATCGVAIAFLSYSYWDVSVHCVRFYTLYIQVQITLAGWVVPFGDPRIGAWLPAPLGLSQVPTSFIASRRQGIHRVPFRAWPRLPDSGFHRNGKTRPALRLLISNLTNFETKNFKHSRWFLTQFILVTSLACWNH